MFLFIEIIFIVGLTTGVCKNYIYKHRILSSGIMETSRRIEMSVKGTENLGPFKVQLFFKKH